MTSYQKLKAKYNALINFLRQIEKDIEEYQKIKTLKDLYSEFDPEVDKIEIVEAMTERLKLDVYNTYKALWRIDLNK